jgi:hypothetical protein
LAGHFEGIGVDHLVFFDECGHDLQWRGSSRCQKRYGLAGRRSVCGLYSAMPKQIDQTDDD